MSDVLKRLEKRDHGTKAEKHAAKRLGGRVQPGSGNQDHSKADIKLPTFLVEAKSTIYASMVVKHDWLLKVSKEALDISREPALIVQFVDTRGLPVPEGSWVMVPERVFKELTS